MRVQTFIFCLCQEIAEKTELGNLPYGWIFMNYDMNNVTV